VSINSKLLGQELYSCQLDCPIFIHIPFPGQDSESKEKISLDLYVPLKFIGAGVVELKPQGSTIKGSAWVNLPAPEDVVEDIFEDSILKKIILLTVASLPLVLNNPLIGLINVVVGGCLIIKNALTPPDLEDITKFIFIPGSGWTFNKGYLNRALSYLYEVLPGAVEPS
jgi:hypothetical protein